MASRSQIQKITSKAIFDNAYRQRLIKSPKKAAEELKISLTKSEIDYIKSLNPEEINRIAADVQYMTHTEEGVTHWA
jgi:hypothetical protein